ncbi:MAG: hypothetical protein ACI4IW_06595 [Oscillospiraceae bacterium]
MTERCESAVKKSQQVALCGVVAALCTVLLFMTGMFPFSTYALPALAGLLMVTVAVETGPSWAFTLYAAVSILSFLMTPDKEAMLMFIMFFGHYPITKFQLEKIKPKLLSALLKLLCFNACIVAAYFIIIYLFQMQEVLSEFGEFGKYSVYILLALGNLLFVTYDFALTQIMRAYIVWFRPRFLRRSSK